MTATIMQRQRFLFAALGLLTLWRWALLPTLELAPEEALAVFQIKHGQAGGLHTGGPLLQLFVWLGTQIGGVSEFGVRFFAPLLALVASLAVWRLARSLFDVQIAGWAVVIVNVLPAFSIAAVTLTPATVLFALVPVIALCVRWALLHAHPLHWAWWAAGIGVLCATLTEPPALGVLAAVMFVFVLPQRLRHHLRSPGFAVIVVSWLLGVGFWLWEGAAFTWPEWRVVPNVLRWSLLASPLLIVLFVLAARMSWDRAVLVSQRSLPLAMLLPLAVVDFFFGPNRRWPDTGDAVWMVFAAILLAHRSAVLGGVAVEQRVSLRTVALVLAALQGAFLLQTDFPRTLGLRWSFSRQTEGTSDYTHFFTADPSRSMRGWREGAKLVAAALAQNQRDGSWFILASDWRLAVELDHYLHSKESVKSLDGDLSEQAGRSAIFVTDDPAAVAPPTALKTRFARVEVLSVARVMHAGNEVRWLKIFACHDYRAPDS